MSAHRPATGELNKSGEISSRAWSAAQLAALGLAGVAAALFAARSQQTEDGADDEAGAFWLLWLLLWAVWRIGQLLFGIAFLLLLVLIVRQRQIIYVPTPPGLNRSPRENPQMYRSPKTWGMPYENVAITCEDGIRIHAWLVYQPASSCTNGAPYTLVYFHGNAGNIGHRLENVKEMYDKLKINILVVDYRGYGDSEDGEGPCEQGFKKDAIGSYRWLMERIKTANQPDGPQLSEDRILLFGRSIGGCAAIALMAYVLRRRIAGHRDLAMPQGLVLENVFTSLREMAVCIFPFLTVLWALLKWPILLDEWKSSEDMEWICENTREWCCCLLSGLKDEIVPCVQMQQHFDRLSAHPPGVLKFFKFPDGGHNDTPSRGGAAYWKGLKEFMAEVTETEEARLKRASLEESKR